MRASLIAGAAVAACVAILLVDAILAAKRDPWPVNATPAAQKQITAARQARKSRDNAVAWTLIASAAAFLIVAKKSTPDVARALVPAASRLVSTPRRAASTPAPAIDLTFIDQLVAQHGRAKEAAIPLLQAIQSHYRYLPDEALRRLCELTEITPAQIAGTSSFYGQFRRSPTGKHIIRVCHGTACHVAGASQITAELRRYLEIPEGADTDASRTFTIDEVACVGCCSLAPVLMVDGQTSGRLTPSTACEALQPLEEKEPA